MSKPFSNVFLQELYCEDAHGNKFIVKAVTRSLDQCHSEEVN